MDDSRYYWVIAVLKVKCFVVLIILGNSGAQGLIVRSHSWVTAVLLLSDKHHITSDNTRKCFVVTGCRLWMSPFSCSLHAWQECHTASRKKSEKLVLGYVHVICEKNIVLGYFNFFNSQGEKDPGHFHSIKVNFILKIVWMFFLGKKNWRDTLSVSKMKNTDRRKNLQQFRSQKSCLERSFRRGRKKALG